MDAENWLKIKQILDDLLDIRPDRRTAFLDENGVSGDIRTEVESLISFESEAADMMQLWAVEFSKDFIDDDSVLNGQEVGPYRITRELGQGGMGAVYLAERIDGKFSQRVALKLLKREMNTGALRRRFQQERKILASLEHPNIARLLDAGTTADKIPFLAMEYVEGLPIDQYCNKNKADLNQRLDLFRKVCSTVDFAHRSLVVHRDLKPSNILVTTDGTPKLLDFGISKILSADVENTATVTKLGVMTPSYASPEQLRNESVTTATDIYSLGIILYELLSGHRPFETKESNLKDIYQAVMDIDPPLPSAIVDTFSKTLQDPPKGHAKNRPAPSNRTEPGDMRDTSPQTISIKPQYLRGDLDNIILKALKKEPARRYSSPENFSEDIRRYLDGLPVTARPDTFSYRAEKFVKRNIFSVIAVTVLTLAVVGGTVATLWQAGKAEAERVKAEKRFSDVRTLANSFLFEFSPLVENLPGSTPARELLVKRALQYLDSLSQEAGDDLELRRDLADAYEKVGDVQGNPYNPNIGDVKGALQSYERALAIREKLFQDEPNNPSLQNGLASVYEQIGGIQANGGDYDKGVVFYEKALALREASFLRDPQSFDVRTKLAKILRSRGLIPFFEGDNKKAIEYYNQSKGIYEKLREEQPENDRIAHDYSYLFVAIGEAQGWDGETELAAENLQKGLDLLIPLGEKYPNDHSFQRSLNLAYSKRGENHEEQKDYDQSTISFSKALEIALRSFNADPKSFQAKRDVALAYKKLAQTLDSAGQSKESLEKLTFALNTFRELSASDPNNAETLYDVANTRYSVGETYLTLKDYDSALATFLLADDEFQRVLSINPNNIYASRMSSYNREGIGKSYAALAVRGNRSDLLMRALENFRFAADRLNGQKENGNLGEYDLEPLAEIEAKIKRLEAKLGL